MVLQVECNRVPFNILIHVIEFIDTAVDFG